MKRRKRRNRRNRSRTTKSHSHNSQFKHPGGSQSKRANGSQFKRPSGSPQKRSHNSQFKGPGLRKAPTPSPQQQQKKRTQFQKLSLPMLPEGGGGSELPTTPLDQIEVKVPVALPDQQNAALSAPLDQSISHTKETLVSNDQQERLTTETVQKTSNITFRIFAICFAAIAISINFANYGPLIPLLQKQLHVDSGQVGLFSTLLFLGIAFTNIPGGLLSDRLGSRTTMIGALIFVTLGSFFVPLFPNLLWMLFWRAIIGLGAGAALVACSHSADELGKHTALGQGFYGGAAQLGAALGIFGTSLLLPLVGWQEAMAASGILGVLSIILWILVRDTHTPLETSDAPIKARKGVFALILILGVANMGTFGLSNGLSAWFAVYFQDLYHLPLELASLCGSLSLMAGIVFRPLGGLLLTRWQHPLTLIRAGTILAVCSVILLALPLSWFPLALLGLLLFAIGTALPFASIFATAARVGKEGGLGSGIAQGLIAVIAAPASIALPPIIGAMRSAGNDYTVTFGTIGLLTPCLAVIGILLFNNFYRRFQRS